MSALASTVQTWLQEVDPEKGSLPMDRAVSKLRDELTVVLADRHRGMNRDLSMALAKLDEAELWVRRYMEGIGAGVWMPRSEILRSAHTDTTDKTVVTESS